MRVIWQDLAALTTVRSKSSESAGDGIIET